MFYHHRQIMCFPTYDQRLTCIVVQLSPRRRNDQIRYKQIKDIWDEHFRVMTKKYAWDSSILHNLIMYNIPSEASLLSHSILREELSSHLTRMNDFFLQSKWTHHWGSYYLQSSDSSNSPSALFFHETHKVPPKGQIAKIPLAIRSHNPPPHHVRYHHLSPCPPLLPSLALPNLHFRFLWWEFPPNKVQPLQAA